MEIPEHFYQLLIHIAFGYFSLKLPE